MANNCCPTEFINGGIFIDPTIQNPTVNGGVFNGITLKNGVTLADDATKQQVVDQICEKFEPCIKQWVNSNSFSHVTFDESTLTHAIIENFTLQGTVQLADSVRKSMAEQLCENLRTCVEGYVNDGEFSSVTLTKAVVDGLTLKGDLSIAATTLAQLVQTLCPLLEECVAGHVDNHTFTGVTLQDPTLKSATLSGGVTFDTVTAQAIITGARDPFDKAAKEEFDKNLKGVKPSDIGALPAEKPNINLAQITGSTISGNSSITGNQIDNNSGTGNEFTDTSLSGGTSISGEILLDTDASKSLCRQMETCIVGLIDSTFNASTVAAVFQDCNGAPHSPGTRLPTCSDLSTQIELAIKSLPALDVIKGVSYDEANRKLIITTQLADGTEQKWEISLDSLGGQVVSDGVTIGGTGTTGDPLHAILTEFAGAPTTSVGEELPTVLFGSRGQLLGTPDKWIDFGGYLLPAFNKPGASGGEGSGS